MAYSYPEYLSGLTPGDYGFDPASLSTTETSFDRYFELELLHARWAMLGAAGALIPGAARPPSGPPCTGLAMQRCTMHRNTVVTFNARLRCCQAREFPMLLR